MARIPDSFLIKKKEEDVRIYPNSFPGRIHKLLRIITLGRNNCGLREEKLKFHVIPLCFFSFFFFLVMCPYCIKRNVNRTLRVIGLWGICILHAFLIEKILKRKAAIFRGWFSSQWLLEARGRSRYLKGQASKGFGLEVCQDSFQDKTVFSHSGERN